MKKFRIKEVNYNNGEVKYFIQKRYFGFIWQNCKMIKVYLHIYNLYISEVCEELPLSTENFLQAKNIKHWLEISSDNCIGYDDNKEIVYLHWSEKESELFLPKYIGSAIYAYALEMIQNHGDENHQNIKTIKTTYHY